MKKFVYKNLSTGEEVQIEAQDILIADTLFMNKKELKGKFPPKPWAVSIKKVVDKG